MSIQEASFHAMPSQLQGLYRWQPSLARVEVCSAGIGYPKKPPLWFKFGKALTSAVLKRK
jgi:hypothetical protein